MYCDVFECGVCVLIVECVNVVDLVVVNVVECLIRWVLMWEMVIFGLDW